MFLKKAFVLSAANVCSKEATNTTTPKKTIAKANHNPVLLYFSLNSKAKDKDSGFNSSNSL
jgi:hypothetical protein